MNDLVVKEDIKIENMIYEVRGKQVMLDSDLARLYQCSNGTKSINLAVKRHINRFPDRFMFQLTKAEYIDLQFQIETNKNNSRFQIETLNKNNQKQGLNVKYLPYAFTEQGVAMLSSILKTEVAEKISIAIMDAFVEMRKYISSNLIKQEYIETQLAKNTEDIKLLQESFDKLSKNKINTSGLFFEGQIYDSYSLLLDIFNTSKENIIIIDNYVDKVILDVLKKINKKVMIITNKYDNIQNIKSNIRIYS